MQMLISFFFFQTWVGFAVELLREIDETDFYSQVSKRVNLKILALDVDEKAERKEYMKAYTLVDCELDGKSASTYVKSLEKRFHTNKV
jgi:hypothetical protein